MPRINLATKNITYKPRAEKVWRQLVDEGRVSCALDGYPFSFINQEYNWYQILYILMKTKLIKE